jgi:hypothetical protein
MNMGDTDKILLGSTFSLALIRREVRIIPSELETLRSIIARRGFVSFWGHANTTAAANGLLGCDVTPSRERPAVCVSPAGYPMLDEQVFRECWILTPNYASGFRPAIGQEIQPEHITKWNVLQMKWH